MSVPVDAPGALFAPGLKVFPEAAGGGELEAIYPLSHMQQGMLFNSLLDPGAGVEIEQLVFRLRETLDAEALAAAWREMTERHAVLRTSVRWEEVEVPVQEVHASVHLPVEVQDWSGLAAEEAEERLAGWLRADRRRGVDPARAPLQRVSLFRRAADDWTVVWTFHHVLLDGRAIALVLEDVFAAYEARRDGREASVSERRPFREYIDWYTRQDFSGSAEFWRSLLDGYTPPTPLPGEKAAGEADTGEQVQRDLRLSREHTAALEALAAERGLTLSAMVQAAWGLLLARHAGVDDVVFGTMRGCHRCAAGGAETVAGPVFNTLPVRLRLRPGASLLEVAAALREQAFALRPHEHTPLQHIQEWCAQGAPLFQTLVLFERRTLTESLRRLGGGWGARSVHLLHRLSVPLALQAYGEPELLLTLTYSPWRFDAATIERLMGQLRAILEAFAADPHQAAEAVDLLGDEERRLLAEWNATDAEFPRDATLHGLFEAQAARTPDAVAATHGTGSVSYAELNARANRLAHHLRRLGVRPEARVGICQARGIEMLVSMLAVLKAGGAYVPLDPAYPAERLEFTLRDARVAVLLTQESLRDLVPVPDGVRVIRVDTASSEIAAERAENVDVPVSPRSLGYLIYTSGSTGVPKGVAIEHESAVALLSWARELHTAEELGGMLACTSICFDLSIYELFLPLSLGGRMIIVDNALALPSAPAAEEVRLVNTVPSAAAALLKIDGIPAGVTTVNLAGEPLRTELVDALYARGIQRVYDLYGPSEDTTYSTWTLRSAGAPATIGRPISNTQAYVLDAGMRPVPVGVPGELYLAGRGLARGYLGRPSLTADRFIPDHLGPEAGGRLYRTGDRVRWTSAGNLEYLGRLDHQVKIRGFRVELGEIESTLRRFPGVRDCVVMAREDTPGETRLAAYLVGAGGDAEALRAHLRRTLPEHFVPAAFVTLEEMPLTPNGKLDRKALPAPEYAAKQERYAPPRTPVEEVLAGICAEVLRVERVGIHDNFFALGGHSLLATRVLARVREALGAVLPLRAFFDAPTVAGLAAAVARVAGTAARGETPLVPVPRDRPLPPSFAQERLWMVERMEGGTAYNIPRAWRLAGPVDAAALDRALTGIVRRHEALRTVFRAGSAGDEAVVLAAPDTTLSVEDLAALEPAAREREAARRVDEEAAHRFDLAAGPLYRFRLLRLGAEEHVLLLDFHHIVVDGWSLGVFVRELDALYAAFSRGEPSPLAELPVRYADYAAWQRERLRGDALRDELAWWRERLAGAPALLELPLDRPRPAVRSQAGALETVALPAELRGRLESLARAEGATLYMVLLAAFQVLLGKYAGTRDVVVGSPIAGRTRAEVEPLIGFFVNTLVLRTDLSGDPAFREVLRRVRTTTLGAFEHQEVPFEKLVEELQPERSLSHTPLVQVLFTLREGMMAEASLAGVDASSLEVHTGTAKFDLALAVDPAEDGLRAELEYATELFDGGTVRRMLAHLVRVLEQAAADPDRRLSALELVAGTEREFLASVSAPADPPADARLFPARFAEQAARTPRGIALVHGGESLTYAELDARANRLAHRLVELGAGPEVRVGVHLPRTPELVVAVLAVLKTGGAYVPLDPRLPADRIERVLADSEAGVLLANAADAARIQAPAGCRTLCIDTDGAAAGMPETAPRVEIHPEHLSHVIYTSGSTGRPKGVMIRHAAVADFLSALHATLPVAPGQRVLFSTSLSFDVHVAELHLALASGATLVLVENALALAEAEHAPLQHASMAPSAAAELLRAGVLPGGIRRMNLGGEAVPAELARGLYAAGIPEVHNFYGPTEDTTYSTHAPLAGDVERMTVGRPLPGKRARVLDEALREVPVGVYGEVYVSGSGEARGYLGQPGMTADRFVPDPFSAAGGRMYRTGDRARWTADGLLEYQGRTDFQVKVRGFRVEPGEIEAVLRERPEVREAVVVARPGAGGNAVLVAYAAPEAGAALDAAALRDHLRSRLPAYMVPSAIVALERLPLNPNGKVDRKALPEPDLAAADDRFVAPRTPAEEALAGIWAEMLGVERVGARDPFFELGGHSLLAMRLVGRIADVFGVELSMRAVFEAPTVAALAERVEAARGVRPSLAPVTPREHPDAPPLSFPQERLWFLDQLQPGSAFYNVPETLRLSGALEVASLERALGEIVRRHEALRTTIAVRGGSAVQVIAPYAGFTLPVEELSALDSGAREAEAARRAADEAVRPFDLAAGPLFRARLLRLADDEHLLLLTLHHAVTDGWSSGVLQRELSALYAAFAEGRESPLAELPVQYADYAAWQREQLRGEALERELGWWKDQLAGAPALLELPTDHPRPAVQSYRGADEAVALPAELLAPLQALARAEGATLYMVLLAAFQVLLGRYAGSEDVVVGSPVAGRTRPEVEELIGFFVNTLVLRTDLSGDPAFREVLRRVRTATLGAYEHQAVPFEKLVEELAPERSLSYAPLFQVMFNLAPAGTPPRLGPVRAAHAYTQAATAKFDLSLALAGDAQGMEGVLQYSTDLFDRATIQRMLGHLRRVLEQVSVDADLPVSHLDLLPETEREVVVGEWNRTDAVYPADACIHTLFEAQAARTPDAPAATDGTGSVTYAELNARANRLAHHLRALGVGAETRVGICQARGIEMLVSMLAVLKAGGAYVPLDPAYPADRLEFTLRDARVAVLLTQESLRGLVPVPDGVRVVCVDTASSEIAVERAENPGIAVSPQNLGYLIYTSGSTGVPKGVAIEHESAVVLLSWAAELHTAEELGGMLACTSICFDLSVYELFLPLSLGGRMIIVDNALALPSAPAADEVRLVNTVPSAAAALLKVGGIPAGVTTINLAGEPLRTELVDALYARGIQRVYDLYGPSEDTTYSTWTLRRAGARATIGRPIANTQAYVLDARMQPVPAGVPGELYLAGRGLARGYLGRPSLTAERFIPDPFGGVAGGRMYRTGDRVRWTAEGTLEYLGRFDHQVKVRGFRIELGEIDTTLRRHPAVRDCAVIVREDAPGERRLVAYVAGEPDVEELRAHLRRSVPEYMAPSAFVTMEALPLTPNGKLDRKALPVPDFGAAADAYVAPRTPVEEVLAGIWAQLLGVERVGVHDDFFALGGHSLLATRLAWRMGEVFGAEVSVRAVLETPTLAQLAERVEAARGAGAARLAPIVRVARTEAMPLSFSQERLWFLDQLEGASAVYNVPAGMRFRGALDVAALERALGEIVRRHEVLRTTLRKRNGAAVQVVAPFAGFALATEDLTALDPAEREAETAHRWTDEVAEPFDLAAGPLFRARLLRLAEDEHVLLLNLHHAVTDGWSMGVLYRELSALYAAFAAGEDSPLGELPVQYADYASWQRAQLQGEALDGQLAWWKEQLAGAPALLELPTDRPRPAVKSYRGADEPVALDAALLAPLQALARAEGATLYMVLLAAFQVLLSKYSGSEDVVVGSPIAGRTRPEVEELIGFFINTLVLRTDLSGEPSFREVLRRVRTTTLGAYEHQDLPFERLVEELSPERSLSHTPLFQVMFNLGAPGDLPRLARLRTERVDGELGAAKFDLSLALAGDAQGMEGVLQYSTDLFDRATVRRMLGHLRRVLERVSVDADLPVSRLDLLPEAERQVVVGEWNRTDAAYPADACIHALFEAQAERTPDAPAVVRGSESLSYAELDARANRLANHLARTGIGPEVRVAVCLEPSPEMIVSVLGVLKAGGAYVPLDPGSPTERLRMMLADAGVAAVLTQASLVPTLPLPDGVRVLSVDGAAAAIAAESAARPACPAGPRSLAYVIYTSGSTGVPKGVGVEHRGACNLVPELVRILGLEPGSRSLLLAPLHFDASVAEIFSALAAGAALHLPDAAEAVPGPEMLALLRRAGITHTKFTPSALSALPAEALPDLATLVVGGEACTAELVARWGAGRRFVNVYGPTEATVRVTAQRCAPGEGVPSIGRPLANTRLYVLDAAGEPVPVGVPGELYVGGVQLARGYLGRAALTAASFVPDPFGGEPGARLYRTGDRVRWKCVSAEVGECGSEPHDTSTDALTHSLTHALEYLGRLDHQVKIRGYRIELGEVGATLGRHPAVRDCAVIVREDAPGDRRLVAYVAGEADAEALRAHLRQSLPEYMVPAAFVSIDALPLTPNGKLDRRALPAPRYAAEDAYLAPRTPVEELLAGIWAQLLGVERVGVHDDFFQLGGHSLLATRLVWRMGEVFGAEVSVRAVLEAPTVAQLAERVEAARGAGAARLAPILRVERREALPLSFAQERLWFLDQMEGGSASYNVPAPLRLSGALDVAALERALGEIVRRHEVLRTTLHPHGGAAVQVVAPFAGFTLPVVDLIALDAGAREAETARRLADEVATPFDLAAGPLVRARLLRLADDEHVLSMTLHHAVTDGWSMGVLFRELSALYAAFAAGEDSPLGELPVQYADYAAWQRAQLRGEALERELGWWKDQLAGAPALLELPADHPRPAVQSYRGADEPVALDPALLAPLQALGRTEGATLYMVLLAAFQVLLSKYSGSEDVVVGSPIAGRTRPEVEELIGFFVNTLVLRTDLSGDPAFREVLRRVRATTLGAYEHQEVPFEKLVEELQPERSLSYAPLFQVMFTLAAAGDLPRLPGVHTERVEGEMGSAKFDLSLALAGDAQGMEGVLQYGTDLFDRATVQRMLGHLRRVLEQVSADANLPISRLELLTDAEREVVVGAWNETRAEYPADACIHALFEAQAARTPDALAVTDGTVSLTYAELNARANRLARRLVRLGVGPEVRVGVCLERGAELIVANLAVLKAGGAYVAMDPTYPAGRLEMMLRDSSAAVLLTDGRGAAPLQAGVRVVRVGQDADAVAAESAADLPNRVTPRGLAYVVYTSGSTGTPKGVAVDHASLGSLCAWAARATGATAETRATQLASPGFDAAVWEVWPYITRGASIHVVPEEVRADPRALRDWLVEQAATVSFIPTPVAEPMLALEWPADAPLRWLATGGDRLRARPRAGMPFALSNNYGPTECTVVATSGVVETDGERAPSIGRPIENTRVYVLDAGLRALPAGVPGELCIGGAQVARGYLNRPALTAERFVPDPFAAEPGARMYRSGDKVRWLADGTVEYLGRLDEQVKVRGFRIELGEIESTLRRHPDVRDCAVIARDDASGEKRLAAYVVGTADADDLRAHLRGSLPDYMVPAAFVALDELPLTPNGKLDRRSLPAPEYALARDRYVAPRTPAEQVMAGIWAEVLGVERVGIHDNFFELGGHSLLATRLASRVGDVFGVALSVRALFEAPTVPELAERVEAARGATAAMSAPVVRVERTEEMPLSFAQERMWFLDQLQPGGSFYNVPAAVRLSGALRVPALERALGEIVRRHEALRTSFAPRQAGAVQVIAPFAGFALATEDLSPLDADIREAEARRLVADEAVRPFDLAAGPLFRARLLRLAEDEHLLLLTLHHAVSDGWSMDVLYRELGALYAAFAEGRESPLAELPVQYADYAAWQREQLAGEVLERELGWWTERLAGAPALLELPTDRPRPALQSYRGAREGVELPAELVARLEALARAAGGSLYMVLLGAWQVLLGRYAGSDDVVVGSPIAGRTRPEVEGLIGLFVNTLVLRTDLSGDPAFREVLGRVRDVTLSAFEHQHTPVETVVRALAPERSLSHAPLFQVMFVLQSGGAGLELPGVRAADAGTGLESAKLDLTLALAPEQGGLRGVLSYSTDLFDRATIRRMLGHLRRVLEQVAADADQPISRLDLLADAERGVVVGEWNETRAAYPADACLHTLFEAQAMRTPDAPAATHGTETVTYAELNAKANRLARHLRSMGVGAETRVGICQSRGIEMLVSMLAVLKAGGAYVPLDPAYPADRLAFILRDARVGVLLTQESLADLLSVPDGVRVIRVDTASSEIAAERAENVDVPVSPRSLGYLIYTSGSTGVPKGVAIEHESAVVLLSWARELHTAEELGGMLACTSICFDLSIYELFLPLSLGGRMIIVDNALALPSAPAADQVRLINTVPSAAAALLKIDGIPAGVTTVNLAGEPLRTELVDALYARGIQRVYDLYGPSEDTTYSTWTLRRSGAPATIGRPISNTQAYVLDAGMRPVPVGVPGELYLGGRGLARGYLGRPSLTADRFIPDHLGPEAGGRLYRTGDRVRWTSAGNLEYLGRLDAQVKVRGYRIELGELETTLRKHPAVRECVVMAPEVAPGDRRLVAYVAGDADAEALRSHLRQTLPEYMVPAAFTMLDALPLNPNGKLDRKALPAPDFGSVADEYVAPRNEVEEALAAVWADVLGVERVGVHDDFFDRGGHSLLATRLVWRIQEALEGEVDLVSLFETPTIAGIAPRLSLRAGRTAPAAAAPVAADHLLDMLDNLSDEELDRLLSADLSNTTLS